MKKSFLTENKAWEYAYYGIDNTLIKYYKEMYFELAYNIRFARINLDCGWRGVADYITKGQTSNQILGMLLCTHAKMFFNETDKDGWN